MFLCGKKLAIACRCASSTVRRRHGRPNLITDGRTPRSNGSTAAPVMELLFDTKQKEGQGAVPFRDSASLASLRGVECAAGVLATDEGWERATTEAARANPQRRGPLSLGNLVPRPDPTRWQTTPEAPFQALRSEEARAALACCNLDSSMVDSKDLRGRSACACSVGDTAIWRRQPRQLETTLAFMLARDEGRLFRVKTADFEDVRSCLLWLRQKNPHVRLLMTNLERFGALYANIQTLIPLGRKDTPVRIVRSPRAAAAVSEAMQLQDTIGSEEAVLVVVDPSELARTWAMCSASGFARGLTVQTPREPVQAAPWLLPGVLRWPKRRLDCAELPRFHSETYI